MSLSDRQLAVLAAVEIRDLHHAEDATVPFYRSFDHNEDRTLESLRRHGLVRRVGTKATPRWSLTVKGVQFMYDHDTGRAAA